VEFWVVFNTVETLGTNGVFLIPLTGRNNSGSYAAYDWNIFIYKTSSLDYANPIYAEHIEGTGGENAFHKLSGLPTNQNLWLRIVPVNSKAQWLRAFATGNSKVSEYDCAYKFRQLRGNKNFTMPSAGMCTNVNGKNAGNYYGFYMFCETRNMEMHPSFTLPQIITTIGNSFGAYMFYWRGGSAQVMGAAFNLPQSVTSVGSSFCSSMFSHNSSPNFVMNDVFNLPPNLTTIGVSFAYSMFSSSKIQNMNAIFNFPQGITSGFVEPIFSSCTHDSFTMNSVFQIPPMTKFDTSHTLAGLFRGCSGAAFTMNSIFRLPEGLDGKQATPYSLFGMFADAGPNFQVNSVFKLPQDQTAEQVDVTYYAQDMFYNSCETRNKMTRKIASIIGNAPAPTTPRGTFYSETSIWSDKSSVNQNWVNKSS
jgi:hypothetical protein